MIHRRRFCWIRLYKNHSQFSYVIDGGDKCHITQWTPRQDNGMFPILVPNIGFKKFADIKPNEGIQFRNLWDSSIIDISGALFTLSFSILIKNSQYEEGGQSGQQYLSPRDYIFDYGDKIITLSPTFFLYPRYSIPIKAQNMDDKYPSRYKFNSSYSQVQKQLWRCQKRSFFQGNIHRLVQGSTNRSFQSVKSEPICPWIHGMIANTIFSTWSSDSRKDCAIWCSINNAKPRCKRCTSAQHESDYEFVKYECKSVNLCILLIKWWLFDDSFTPISIRLSIIRFGPLVRRQKSIPRVKYSFWDFSQVVKKNAKSKWKAANGKQFRETKSAENSKIGSKEKNFVQIK